MKLSKKILVPVLIVALLVGSFFGARAIRSKTQNAEVIPVSTINMDWFGDETSIDGMVYDSDSQSIYVSSSQVITDIYVQMGQQVKAGDPLMAFDKTSQEITLQIKELGVLRAENELENAYAELRRLQNTTPIPEPSPMPIPEPDPDPTPVKPVKKQVKDAWNYLDGNDKDLEKYYLSPIVMYEDAPENPIKPTSIKNTKNNNTDPPSQGGDPGQGGDPDPGQGGDPDPSQGGDPDPGQGGDPDPGQGGDPDPGQGGDPDPGQGGDPDPGEGGDPDPGEGGDTPTPTPTPAPTPIISDPGTLYNPLRYLVAEDGKVYGSFLNKLRTDKPKTYVVIEVRSGNKEDGPLLASWTLYTSLLTEQDDDATWSIAMKPIEDDTEELDPETEPDDSYDYPDGYTAAELAQAIYYQQNMIRDLDLSLRRSRLDLEIHKEQMEDGVVKAKRNGTVTFVGDVNNLPQDGSAFLKVEAGKGVLIQGGITELLLDTVEIGQEVTATSWETGMSYVGEISSIDEYPMDNSYYYYGGNPNSSTYGFLAYFEDADDLSSGDWIQLSISAKEDTTSIYIPAAYVRNDAKGKYVMKDEDGKLKKQYIRTGKSFYGEYIQILEGISTEDMLAFPYGAGATEGTKTTVSDGEGMYY